MYAFVLIWNDSKIGTKNTDESALLGLMNTLLSLFSCSHCSHCFHALIVLSEVLCSQ